MREAFQQELNEVRERLVDISELVSRIIEDASNAFLSADKLGAERAIATTALVEERVLQLDELVVWTMARQAPVAQDLRTLVSALRISSSFDRMAALAGHIAQIAQFRFPESAVPSPVMETFKEMAKLDIQLSHKLTTLLKTLDVNFAHEIQAEDERVDELHRSVFAAVLAPEWKEQNTHTVDVTLASRYFERFADHVVSISSKISYLTTGDWNEYRQG